MKSIFKKITATCLTGCMIIGLVPLSAQAGTTAGVIDAIGKTSFYGEESGLFAGINAAFGEKLYLSASIAANETLRVATLNEEAALEENEDAENAENEDGEEAEEFDLYAFQNAAEAAKVDAEDVSNLAVARVESFVNVRREASTDSDVVGKLYNKNVATVLYSEDGWYKIQSGNVRGYVKAEYLVVGNGEALKAAGTRYATINADSLRVRKKPSTEADILGRIPQGEDVLVVSEEDGWVKISIEEGNGYVSGEFVTLHTEFTFGETKAEEKARLLKEANERAAAQRAAAAATSRSTGSSSSGGRTYRAPSGTDGSSVVNYAMQFVGNPYRWGGTSLTNGADCSGFVMSVYAAFGVSLPHSSTAMRSCGRAVSRSEMKPGDIVCFSGHVAIYAGNNTIVHASNRRTGIRTSSLNHYSIITIRRIF